MDGGAWWATVHGAAKSRTRLSDFTFTSPQLVKNPPVMRETWVQSLGWEDSPGEGKGYPLLYSGLENSTD